MSQSCRPLCFSQEAHFLRTVASPLLRVHWGDFDALTFAAAARHGLSGRYTDN